MTSLLINLLAVAGGAAAGAAGTDVSARVAGRFFALRRVPRPALYVLRALGAGAVGLAVWMWVFGTGAGGWGPGGGGSVFGGKGAGDAGNQPVGVTSKQPVTAQPAASSQGDRMTVIMLGGDRVKDQRFYRVEGEREAKTLDELKDEIKTRQKSGKLKTIEILVYEDSVARNHATVRELNDWAWQNGLTAIIPPSRAGNAP